MDNVQIGMNDLNSTVSELDNTIEGTFTSQSKDYENRKRTLTPHEILL